MKGLWKFLVPPMCLALLAFYAPAFWTYLGGNSRPEYSALLIMFGVMFSAAVSIGMGLIQKRRTKKKKVDEAKILARMRDARPGRVQEAISTEATQSPEVEA